MEPIGCVLKFFKDKFEFSKYDVKVAVHPTSCIRKMGCQGKREELAIAFIISRCRKLLIIWRCVLPEGQNKMMDKMY
ncbi:MAG: hypothetical protein COA36_09535 [Desulfotalea sp.]|nr:MAG: hypothetical protein COA36_09535 [Desulfotalea sp.]